MRNFLKFGSNVTIGRPCIFSSNASYSRNYSPDWAYGLVLSDE